LYGGSQEGLFTLGCLQGTQTRESVTMPRRRISEAETRKELIDPQLEKAGWILRDHAKVKIEIPVDGYDAEPWNGVTDYALYRGNGEVLAVVEAKKTVVDVRLVLARGV
jgi:type I site-specific restriction endonuclease